MATLTDRLDYIVGKKAADALDEIFGIRTVDDLLRHYPRKYSKGSSVFGEGDDPPEEGEHITFVDTITRAETRCDQPDAARSTWSSRWGTVGRR